MIETIKSYAGLVALVILAIMAASNFFGVSSQSAGTAVDCTSNTCFTSLGVTGAFQVDGASIFNGGMTYAGIQNFAAAIYASSTLQISGTQTNFGSTTLASIRSTDPTFGMQIFPTSTATVSCLTFAATTTASAFGNTGLVPVTTYGACN